MTSKLESGNAVLEEESVQDLFCDPKNPKVVTFENVCKAAHLIRKGVEHTLCLVRNKIFKNLKLDSFCVQFPEITFVRKAGHGNLSENGIPANDRKF